MLKLLFKKKEAYKTVNSIEIIQKKKTELTGRDD